MKYLPVLLILLFAALTRCAKQTTPTGGPRDTIPPRLVQAIPAHETTGYKGQRIALQFNEPVIVNNPREQLLITPSVGKDFEMTVRKQTVYLDLNTDLRDSTTYTINFRESIQDITEKNPAPNLQLALSTGTYIDSLHIAGHVYELLKGVPAQNAAVALYQAPDTFDIFAHKPEYLTLCDKEGNFLFQNLRPGAYYIYAFNDKNRNITVDSRSEAYGFLSEPIHLQPESNPFVRIPIISLDARPLRLISARPYNTYFNIRTSKYLDHYQLRTEDPQDSVLVHHTYGPDQANIQVYLPEITADSIAVHFLASDSIGNQLDTLLYAKTLPRTATPETFSITLTDTKLYPENYMLSAAVSANKPIRALNYDSILYVLDSTITIPLAAQDIRITDQTNITLNKILPAEHFTSQTAAPVTDNFRSANTPQAKLQINRLRLGKGAVMSIENDSSAATELAAAIIRPDNTGIITVGIETVAEHFIVKLLTKDYTVRQLAYDQKEITFRNLSPGDYILALIIDHNANRKWDAGNFYRKQEPEPVVFYRNEEGSTTIGIKANWELGPLLITYPEPVDNPSVPARNQTPSQER